MQRRSQIRRTRQGFTLLEILIVLGIIGVIAAMAVPRLVGQQRTASIKQTRSAILALEQALDLYSVSSQGQYPQSLTMLMQQGPDNTDPVLDKVPVDAWGNPLNYEWPNTKANNPTRPAVWSNGPNAQNENGNGDDINNWADTIVQ